jgi:hypothetical protein
MNLDESNQRHQGHLTKMRTITRVLIAATLVFGSGCASSDWIERTLVTVDVTGTWMGNVAAAYGGSRELVFQLEQKGSAVRGFMRFTGGGATPFGVAPGPIDGTVAGDVFRFRLTNGSVEGELTVSGDEMNGRASIGSGSSITLRRVDSPPDSPRR